MKNDKAVAAYLSPQSVLMALESVYHRPQNSFCSFVVFRRIGCANKGLIVPTYPTYIFHLSFRSLPKITNLVKMVMMEKKMMSPFNRLSKQSKQKTIQARYLVFATLIALFVVSLVTTNQSSSNIRGSIKAARDLQKNATIVSDIREVLDLVDDKSDSNDDTVANLLHEAANEVVPDLQKHEEATDSPEEVSSQVAGANRDDNNDDDDDETIFVDTTSTTDNTSLQERLLFRSIEVRNMISKTLLEAAEHIPSPKYFHFNPQYEEEGSATDHSCDKEDAYAGVAVDGWMPPQFGYPIESLNEWYKEYDASMKKIKNKDSGGRELRDFAAKETQKLRERRHRLFCED